MKMDKGKSSRLPIAGSHDIHERAREALLRDHAAVLETNVPLSGVLVLAVAAVLWFQSSRLYLVIAVAIVLMSVVVSWRILRTLTATTTADEIEKRLIAIQLLGGAAWGGLLYLAMPSESGNQLFLALTVPIALAANAMETTSSARAFLAFHIPFAVLAGLAFWLRVDEGSAQIVVSVVLCAVYFAVLARVRGIASQEHAELSLQNEALAARLQVLNEDLSYRSTHDTLTDLPNRLAIERFLHEAIVTAEEQPVAALFIDLDGFKDINDTMGHDAGDDLLVIVARRFAQVAPADALLGRLGGDEMVVLWPGFGDITAAHAVADALLESLVSPITVNGVPNRVGASIGISMTSPTCRSARDLLRFADIALYSAKALGGRQWVEFCDVMLDAPSGNAQRVAQRELLL